MPIRPTIGPPGPTLRPPGPTLHPPFPTISPPPTITPPFSRVICQLAIYLSNFMTSIFIFMQYFPGPKGSRGPPGPKVIFH